MAAMSGAAREEAVRRLRAESARRIERRGRVRAFSSWCALATLGGAISLAALDARETGLERQQRVLADAAAAEHAKQVAIAAEAARLEQLKNERLCVIRTEAEKERIRADAARARKDRR